jgi:putative FmdB family regulatory protein
MPIYEYACRRCHHKFETIVRRASETPVCAACGSVDLERLLSIPAIKSESTHRLAMTDAQARETRRGSEAAQAQKEYESHHND